MPKGERDASFRSCRAPSGARRMQTSFPGISDGIKVVRCASERTLRASRRKSESPYTRERQRDNRFEQSGEVPERRGPATRCGARGARACYRRRSAWLSAISLRGPHPLYEDRGNCAGASVDDSRGCGQRRREHGSLCARAERCVSHHRSRRLRRAARAIFPRGISRRPIEGRPAARPARQGRCGYLPARATGNGESSN